MQEDFVADITHGGRFNKLVNFLSGQVKRQVAVRQVANGSNE